MRYHVTITQREPSRNGGADRSYMLVGTEIAARVAEVVAASLKYGGGPITLTVVHPVNVEELSA